MGTLARMQPSGIRPGERRDLGDRWLASFPAGGPHRLSHGIECASPFFVPDGSGLMIFGTADLAAVEAALTGESFHAVQSDGRALMCLWLTEFRDSTVGAYNEMTVTILVADALLTLPWTNALTLAAAQLRADVTVCEHVLVLDNQGAIDYGRELHGFDKHAGRIELERRGSELSFSVAEGDTPILAGRARLPGIAATLGSIVRLGRALGVGPTLAALVEREHVLRVVTPSTIKSTRSRLHFRGFPTIGAGDGDLEIHATSPIGKQLAGYQFKPVVSQWLAKLRGVMPLPERG